MLARLHVSRASWTLANQGVVSLGTFLVNVQLARQLPAEDYGAFALLLGSFLALQLFNSSLLLYPMSIRLPVMQGPSREQLLSATGLLVAALCVPLSLVLAIGLEILGRPDLILPVLLAFLLWQMQEMMRRGLLADFRYSTAIIGDTVTYLGQVCAIAALAYSGHLTLPNALYAMATASGLGAIIQAWQLGFSHRHAANLRNTFNELCAIGSWSLANNVVSILRIQVFLWALAAAGGAVAAASFQAAFNVVNLANPIILGLCNVIPQTAAHARESGGNAQAWRAARVYMLLGVPPIFGYYALVLMAPSLFLGIFYGSASPYLSLTLGVQILVVAWAIGYAADMTCSYLHGVNGARVALVINSLGAISAVVLALPLTQKYGLTGGCLSMLGANLVRLVASYFAQKWVTADACAA
jgi:O-antigen/teichoic acid export membrane protein